MSDRRNPVVYDCNVLFQALVSPDGPAGRCVTLAFENKVTLFCSERVLEELFDVASRTVLRAKFASLTDERLETFIEAIEAVARFPAVVPETFQHCRDQDDNHYVNLALATHATYVVTRDKDLHELMDPQSPVGKKFLETYELRIVDPPAFLRTVEITGSGA